MMMLSDGEKLILLMLSDLYDRLEIKGSVDHRLIAESIRTDNTWGIPFELTELPLSDRGRPHIVSEVFDILDMWRMIETSYNSLTDKEHHFIKEKMQEPVEALHFLGFDENEEDHYLVVCHYIVATLHRYSEFSGRKLIAPLPQVGRYRRMLEMYQELRDSLSFEPLLTKEQIVSLLRA